MVKELVIQAWCDVCLATRDGGSREPAVTSHTVTVDDIARDLDLCTEHAKPVADMLVFLDRYGTSPDRVPVAPGSRLEARPHGGQTGPRSVPDSRGRPVKSSAVEARTCPVCGSVSATRPAMRDHLKRAHRTNLSRLGLSSPRGRYAKALKTSLAAEKGDQGSLVG